ncbi:virion membrane protein A16 [BeAn 58058 virus]|uniref:virion membrane protein A16 n=1 Tax=BeAn 58058 virus TaxID=67082 RepID=UPI00090AA12B|nr:virion membrane protein A16 [BeAn 58058 virus]APG58325.1 virion membrane protein A16 [BeAn 58058 virus]
MVEFCKTNPDNTNCIKWLRTKRLIALSTYSDICSNDMDKRYCSEFIRVCRPEYYTFGDTALLNFCKKHKANQNCWCVFPPRQDSYTKYLGPRACWTDDCTDKSRDRKWLLYDQDVQRTRCKYTGCGININSLNVNKSNVDLIADCRGNKTQIGDIDPGKPKINKCVSKSTPIFFSFMIIFIVIFILFYFLLIYSRKRIKTKVINVSRG